MSIDIEIEAEAPELRRAAEATLEMVGVDDGHVAIQFVPEDEMRAINREHRGLDKPTDVVSFPIDGVGEVAGPRELGDVVICREHTTDVTEAVVHGVLHLCGFDHETDSGEMLALQDRIVDAL